MRGRTVGALTTLVQGIGQIQGIARVCPYRGKHGGRIGVHGTPILVGQVRWVRHVAAVIEVCQRGGHMRHFPLLKPQGGPSPQQGRDPQHGKNSGR